MPEGSGPYRRERVGISPLEQFSSAPHSKLRTGAGLPPSSYALRFPLMSLLVAFSRGPAQHQECGVQSPKQLVLVLPYRATRLTHHNSRETMRSSQEPSVISDLQGRLCRTGPHVGTRRGCSHLLRPPARQRFRPRPTMSSGPRRTPASTSGTTPLVTPLSSFASPPACKS